MVGSENGILGSREILPDQDIDNSSNYFNDCVNDCVFLQTLETPCLCLISFFCKKH